MKSDRPDDIPRAPDGSLDFDDLPGVGEQTTDRSPANGFYPMQMVGTWSDVEHFESALRTKAPQAIRNAATYLAAGLTFTGWPDQDGWFIVICRSATGQVLMLLGNECAASPTPDSAQEVGESMLGAEAEACVIHRVDATARQTIH